MGASESLVSSYLAGRKIRARLVPVKAVSAMAADLSSIEETQSAHSQQPALLFETDD
jgi:hypothetical protein